MLSSYNHILWLDRQNLLISTLHLLFSDLPASRSLKDLTQNEVFLKWARPDLEFSITLVLL